MGVVYKASYFYSHARGIEGAALLASEGPRRESFQESANSW
jgi:hypothetical protein